MSGEDTQKDAQKADGNNRSFGRSLLNLAIILLFIAAGLVWGSLINWPFNPQPETKAMADMYRPLVASPADFGAPAGIFANKNRSAVYNYFVKQQETLNNLWSDYFSQVGLEKPEVSLIIVHEGSYQSGCRRGFITSNNSIAFYCSADNDGAVWLPLDSLITNDSAAMYVLTHENGHHIQDELRKQLGLPDISGALGGEFVESELIADCLAGVTANSFKRGGKLNKAQEDALLLSAQLSADCQHGTAEQIASAYRLGLDAGTPLACISRYWVTLR